MKENVKLGIFEAAAALCGLLAIVFCSLPSYIESSSIILTDFQLIFGNDRTETSGLLIFGFILLVIGCLIGILGAIGCFTNKLKKDKYTMIIGISQTVATLIGGVIITCAILITGLDKANSELGLIQGNWSIGIANFLVIIFTLVSCGLSYPAALIVLHHKDQKDASEKKTPIENPNK